MNQVTLSAFNNELSKLAFAPIPGAYGAARSGAGAIARFGTWAKGKVSSMFKTSPKAGSTYAATPAAHASEHGSGFVATKKKPSKLRTATKFGLGAAGLGAATVGGGILYGGMKMEPDIANSNISEPQTPSTSYGGRYY